MTEQQDDGQHIRDMVSRIRQLKAIYTQRLEDRSYKPTYKSNLRSRIMELQKDELKYMEWAYE